MAPVQPAKRPLEEADDPVPIKRGRGRPRKASPDRKTKPKVPGRGRGRPRIPLNERKTKPKVPGRGRGRPRKDQSLATTPAKNASPKDESLTTPEKNASPKDETFSTPKENPTTLLTLSKLIGTYEINCEEVQEQWPELAEELSMSISPIPHTKAGLLASFSMGFVKGTMLIAADKETAELIRDELDGDGESAYEPDQSADITLENNKLYLIWRGRDISDKDEVCTSSDRQQTGVINLTPPTSDVISFQARACFPKMDICEFTGIKISDKPEQSPEPWTAFDNKRGTEDDSVSASAPEASLEGEESREESD
ncbi:hypothetical protein DM02DRAFT_623608 [Periconia macrospinosa]|uniref:AT hook domain-containing protein n=1 Tax=Periconia macrospinosa TaxID=97972 RepID=A0A2V1E8E8_9PLEO|nr:hypothetical protein DM02DRAFT_623608 [Periconia macrospinosa]